MERLTRRSVLVGAVAVVLTGCKEPEKVVRYVPPSYDAKISKAIVLPYWDINAIVEAKADYADHFPIYAHQKTTGRKFDEITIHPNVWQSTDPYLRRWLDESVKSRLKSGGALIHLHH